jgi:hypothetical protein
MLNELKANRKAKTKAEKLELKEEKDEIDKVYGWAFLNGRKEKVRPLLFYIQGW